MSAKMQGLTALSRAAQDGNLELVRVLLKVCMYVLYVCREREMVQVLLKVYLSIYISISACVRACVRA